MHHSEVTGRFLADSLDAFTCACVHLCLHACVRACACCQDYTGADVNVHNLLAALLGNASAIRGGSGKVRASLGGRRDE